MLNRTRPSRLTSRAKGHWAGINRQTRWAASLSLKSMELSQKRMDWKISMRRFVKEPEYWRLLRLLFEKSMAIASSEENNEFEGAEFKLIPRAVRNNPYLMSLNFAVVN